ncbi:MAG: hypothetical protein EXX96DRAFT_542327 [Benjaminiella poitrasii]|nr:MAG: hypothetical protein EXX96DRAFT_542327 [Benjaminiella poitrasii]
MFKLQNICFYLSFPRILECVKTIKHQKYIWNTAILGATTTFSLFLKLVVRCVQVLAKISREVCKAPVSKNEMIAERIEEAPEDCQDQLFYSARSLVFSEQHHQVIFYPRQLQLLLTFSHFYCIEYSRIPKGLSTRRNRMAMKQSDIPENREAKKTT